MKIAVATDDGRTVARHFGRAPHYAVFTLSDGEVADLEIRDKAGHRVFAAGPGPEPSPTDKHNAMITSITDCSAVIAGGMGPGARHAIEAAGIVVVLTSLEDAVAAASGYASGDLESDPDRTCRDGGNHRH